MNVDAVEVAQAIVIVGAATEVLRRVGKRVWRFAVLTNQAVHLVLAELQPNGGGSLSDRIGLCTHRLESIEQSLRVLERTCPAFTGGTPCCQKTGTQS